MMYRPASLLTLFALLAVAYAGDFPPLCLVEQSTMVVCIATNGLTCGFACQNGEFEALEFLSSDCSSKDGFCAFSACCPACDTETAAYKECLLDSSCDMDCPAVVPTAPTPSEDDDFASPECATEGAAYQSCVGQNIAGCFSCFEETDDGDTGPGTDEDKCADIPKFCETLTCCAACIPQAKAFVTCEANVNGCAEDCSDIAPAAPSPITPYTFPPEFLPACLVEQSIVSACIATNIFDCVFPCQNGELDALEFLSSDCSSKDEFCAFSACCPACDTETAAYKECLLDSSCDMDCPAVVPTAPSPVSIFPPAFASEDDDFISSECATEGTAYQFCVIQNLAECFSCSGNTVPGTGEDKCADIPEICENLTCCAACIPQAKAFVACEANANGCAEDCSDIAPAAPSPIAPFTFPVFAPDAFPTLPVFDPVASPATDVAETAAPVTSSPVVLTEPTSASPVTSAPVLVASPAPVTASPVTSAPVVAETAAPVTSSPVVPNPSASPVTSAPVLVDTAAPVTSAPVDPIDVTTAPSASGSSTKATVFSGILALVSFAMMYGFST